MRQNSFSDSAVVALYLPSGVGSQYALEHERAIPPEDMHITLAYLGRVDDLEDDRETIAVLVGLFAMNQDPVSVRFSGTGRFTGVDDGQSDAFYLGVDSDELQNFRAKLMAMLAGFTENNERDYVPHVTLAYLAPEETAPIVDVNREQVVTFDTVVLSWGEEQIAFPLGAKREAIMQPIYQRAFPEVGNRAEELLKNKSLPVPFIASTEGMKRDGFDLKADEWDLSRYMNYPVVLYGHDITGRATLPIGRGTNARVEEGKLRMDVLYDEDDEFAMKCRNKAIKGMMAGSVSWDTERAGDKNRNILIEFSNVNVGLDPDALPELELARVRSMIGEPQYKSLIDQIRQDVIKSMETPEEEEEQTEESAYYIQVGETRYEPEQTAITTTSSSTFWYVEDGRLVPQPEPETAITEEVLRRVIQEELANLLENEDETDSILIEEGEAVIVVDSPVELTEEQQERIRTLFREVLNEQVDTQVETQDDLDELEQGEGGEPDLWINALDQIHLAFEDKV